MEVGNLMYEGLLISVTTLYFDPTSIWPDLRKALVTLAFWYAFVDCHMCKEVSHFSHDTLFAHLDV